MKILLIIESGIGNVVMMTPLIKSLHRIYDKPEITLLTSSYREEGKVLKDWFYLKDCIFSADGLKHEDFDKIIISQMYGNNFNSFLQYVPPDKIEITSLRKPYDWHRNKEVEVNMRFPRREGYLGITPFTEVPIKKPKNMPKLSKTKIKIGIHAGALNHPDWKSKLWMNERWEELALKLKKQQNAQIIWVGFGEDYFNEKIGLNFVNKLEDIRETSYVINECDFFITCDSGNSHISNALHVPTITLYGSTLQSKNKPWNEPNRVIQSNLPCQPCYGTEIFFKCRNYACMEAISVDDVYDEFISFKEEFKRPVKVFLIACRQLGHSFCRTFDEMENVEYTYYDYVNESYDFSEEANKHDIVIVLKGIGVNFEYMKNVTSKKVLMFNDNVCRYREEFEQMRLYFDWIFTSNKDNEPGTQFLPFGIDTSQFYDMNLLKTIDVSFIGNPNSLWRIEWLRDISSKIKLSHFHGIDYAHYVPFMNKSKITINQHYNECGPNMRFFEAMACKSLMITDKIKGIPKDMKDGIHYVSYDDTNDLADVVGYYLKNDKERQKITDAAYNLVTKKHKYSDRFKELFNIIHERRFK